MTKLHPALVVGQQAIARHLERLTRHLRRYIGIAVPIAADPGAKGKQHSAFLQGFDAETPYSA